MQELTDPPAMNSPYSITSGSYGAPDAPNAPKLGALIPGTTGGLPQKAGLTVAANPLPDVLRGEENLGTRDALYDNMPKASAYPPAMSLSGAQNQGQQQEQQGQGMARGGLAHAAERTRQMGRGQDTMLIHMTPNEVNSLQGLAMAMGGSLTINPHTGLPEAGWLGKLLPTILGGVLAATGVGAPLAAGIVGLGQTAITGDLGKGLMAGLGAFGGASLAGAAGLGGSISKTGFGILGKNPGIFGSYMGAGAPIVTNTAPAMAGSALGNAAAIDVPASLTTPVSSLGTPAFTGFEQIATPGFNAATGAVNLGGNLSGAAGNAITRGLSGAAANTVTSGGPFTGGFFSKFGQAAKAGLPSGIISKMAPTVAGMGLSSSLSNAFSPSGMQNASGAVDNSYQGPYHYQKREATFAPSTEDLLSSSAERDYFKVDQPEVYNAQNQLVMPGSETAPGTSILQAVLNPNAKKGQPMYSFQSIPYMQSPEEIQRQQLEAMGYAPPSMARGGKINMDNGSFVMDARSVSEIGNGSSNAGMELLRKLGGLPVQGPGDGVSDSVPAKIGGKQEARVARDEVIFPAQAVQRLGGAKKLYALMEKAHKARKRAGRGTDTKVAKGLGAL